MVFEKTGHSLISREWPIPELRPHEILIAVKTCGVCRTDLHIYEGDLIPGKRPLVLGHEIVGIVSKTGKQVEDVSIGDRVGVPWLGNSCGQCEYCRNHRENLCDDPKFTGYDLDGGYAQYTVADARYCFKIPEIYSDTEAAPLLCAGLIGYRALRMAGAAKRIGLYGFGAAAHIVAQIAQFEKKEVYAFTRPGDTAAQSFAKKLGAAWSGDSDTLSPTLLDAAILFAPVGALILLALKNIKKGGTVVCAGIHMSPIPAFTYDLLWGERVLRSVANLTRQDGIDFFDIAPKVPVRTKVHPFPLEAANEALSSLKAGQIQGAAVLVVNS